MFSNIDRLLTAVGYGRRGFITSTTGLRTAAVYPKLRAKPALDKKTQILKVEQYQDLNPCQQHSEFAFEASIKANLL